MASQIQPYPLRIDEIVMAKAKSIAKENGRSLNKEIEFVLKQYVASYEQVNGEIQVEE